MPLQRQTFAAFSLAMASLLALSGCSFFGGEPEKKVAVEEAAFLMVLWAPSGTLEQLDGKGHAFQLSLKEAAPSATFYSDRPKRLAGQVPLGLLVESWPKMGFADRPPVAALMVNQGGPEQLAITGEVIDPQWDPQTRSLSLTLRPGPSGFADPFAPPSEDTSVPATFGQTSLLIDPSGYSGVEYLVTGMGVVALRETYAEEGKHPIDVLPHVTYIGPDYFGTEARKEEIPMVAVRGR